MMTNPDLDIAFNLIEHTGCNVFLTGKAGTGKTTFLEKLSRTTAKRMIVTAPTGVAAINAGGVTLHSFFQLPFGPFIPGNSAHQANRQRLFRFSKEKRNIIRSLDLLVIDEISMVRADLLDSVDAVLRHHRRREEPFGGVQLLMIGDLHQLSPVAKPDERRLLEPYYESIYFFSSRALSLTDLVTVELKHIYRQADPEFISLLNQVRDNRLDPNGLAQLNRRHINGFEPEDDQGYITLTTHNNSSQRINAEKLKALSGNEVRLEAEVSGDFPEQAWPTPGSLILKQGAQVMFLRNDSSGERRYYNGKIGRISAVSAEKVEVLCPDETEAIRVDPVEWENIAYTLDPETNDIKETVIGKFRQLPLKLAWAITIHKSQGLTFDKAVIDARDAFTHGQVYVALSRLTSLSGLILTSPIPPRGMDPDPAVAAFTRESAMNPPTQELLEAAKISFQQRLLMACFDLDAVRGRLRYLAGLVSGNSGLVRISGSDTPERILAAAGKEVFPVSEKFRRQLMSGSSPPRLPESDAFIRERTIKASAWFLSQFKALFTDLDETFQVDTDNRELGKKISNAIENLRQEIRTRIAGIASCADGFSPSRYLRAVADAEASSISSPKKKPMAPVYSQSDIDHPELFNALRDWRSKKARDVGIAHFQILHQRVLIQIAVRLPDNRADLKKISGIGKKTMENYGEDLLDLVRAYRESHGIDHVDLPDLAEKPEDGPPENKKSEKPDTRKVSFDLFNQGFSTNRIAEERGLAESTVYGHLASFIESGDLNIRRLVSEKTQKAIEAAIALAPDRKLKTIKEAMEGPATYNEIKLVLAHQGAQKKEDKDVSST